MRIYEGFTSVYATIVLKGGGRRGQEGGERGYAGRGRAMHIDAGLHEFFILFYDFESHSLIRKFISPLAAILVVITLEGEVTPPTMCVYYSLC